MVSERFASFFHNPFKWFYAHLKTHYFENDASTDSPRCTTHPCVKYHFKKNKKEMTVLGYSTGSGKILIMKNFSIPTLAFDGRNFRIS
jgi:hypothetical protein